VGDSQPERGGGHPENVKLYGDKLKKPVPRERAEKKRFESKTPLPLTQEKKKNGKMKRKKVRVVYLERGKKNWGVARGGV